MSTNHTVPLAVLVRAAAALKTVKDLPVGQPVMGPTWYDILTSYNELSYQLELVMKNQSLAVSTT